CAQQLPPGFDARPNLEPTVVEELHQRGVRFVDLLQAYAGDPELLYHHYGSHWNERGQRLAAEAVAKSIGQYKPLRQRWGLLKLVRADYGDIDNLVGPGGVERGLATELANTGSNVEMVHFLPRKKGG